MSTKTIHGNSQFQKPPSLRWTWESPGGQFHNEIDHITFNRRYCLTDLSVVPMFYTGSDHRLLRARFRFSRQGEKAAKFKKRSPRTTINWDLYTSLVGLWEDAVMDNVDEEYDRFVHHLHDSAKGAESLKATKRRLSPETLELISQRGAALASGNYQLTSELAKLCRAAIKENLKERRAEVLAEAAEAGWSIRNARRNFANIKTKMTALRRPDLFQKDHGEGWFFVPGTAIILAGLRITKSRSANVLCTPIVPFARTPSHVVGKFVHVEQKEASRENISLWTSVIEDAFIVGGSSSQLSAVVVISLSVVIVFS
ncbi:unnamed protein product [Heligmosomoides polygyrus]|uniref:HA domain-containing protein n=1 Tax=Heligmosomoides polygyrus TaxID=6339 RepID=A0A183FXV7_HELPZ|nr:unnamed protein product [Heligmosomoides polygyrus]